MTKSSSRSFLAGRSAVWNGRRNEATPMRQEHLQEAQASDQIVRNCRLIRKAPNQAAKLLSRKQSLAMWQRSRTSEHQPYNVCPSGESFNPRRIVSVRIIPSRRLLHRKRSKAGSLLTSIEELHAIDNLVRCSMRNGAPDEIRTHDPQDS
jgi:hypothetical protein